MDIYSRFMALPRARKGTTTVVIVEESALAELIAAAQTSEALLFGARVATVGMMDFKDPANPSLTFKPGDPSAAEGTPLPPPPYAEHLKGPRGYGRSW